VCKSHGTAQFSFTDEASMFCPICKKPMDRLYSSPGLIFKGGGWGGKS
jgi:predicted nucleic acid-binding Zn ribbon protein